MGADPDTQIARQHGRSPHGFTLIEMLVVLSLVATLLLMVAPRYMGQLDASKEAVLRDNLRTMRQVLDAFHADQGRYPETLQELVDTHYLRALPLDPMTGTDQDWVLIEPPDGIEGRIYDLRSSAPGEDRHGRPYATW